MILTIASRNVPDGQYTATLTDLEIVDTPASWLDSHPNASKRQWRFSFRIEDKPHTGTVVTGFKFAWHGDGRDRAAMAWVATMLGMDPDNMREIDVERDLIGAAVVVTCATFTASSVVTDVQYSWGLTDD